MAVSREGYVAVVLCGHSTVRVFGIFTTLIAALAYVKANFRCEPMGKHSFDRASYFVTRQGEVIKVQPGVHIYTSED